jgi:hypothetical protein
MEASAGDGVEGEEGACRAMKQGNPSSKAAARTSVAVAFAMPTGWSPASFIAATKVARRLPSSTSPPTPADAVRTPPRGKG